MKNSDVQKVNRLQPKLKTRFFIFKQRANGLKSIRIAFIFTKKSGNAVMRNRFKRRMRALLQANTTTDSGQDFLCIAKGALSQITDQIWQIERTKIRTWCENI